MMAVDVAELKERIDAANERRAALLERRRSAEADREEAEAGLKKLKLTPKNAKERIEALESELVEELETVEEALGIE
jgi:chromosome segregation ATPase